MIQKTILSKYLLLRHSEEQGDVAISFLQKCKRLPRFLTKTRNDVNSQKAAMFGLDARIALAIFGALSVIAGSALYTVIEKVKVTAFCKEIIEMGYAIEQYTIDTGVAMPSTVHHVSVQVREVFELTSSSKAGWKGPYFNFNEDDGDGFYYAGHKTPLGNTSHVVIWRVNSTRSGDCSYGDCYYWISANYISKKYAAAIKKYFDNTDDLSHSGKVRILPQGTELISVNYRAFPTWD